ncbi:MAG: ATP-dependent RecD-like DNA helicase [Clostridiales bacterium]|nr:ATP-dependent RecD-like DNA helicase [Clostridiales bacterium]
MEQVEGSVLGTIYRNDENGYTVLTVREGRRELTIVGTLPELHPGEQAVFSGEWISHPQYGRQLKCTGVELKKPTTLLGIERYLGSGIIRGVGPSTARTIVAHFGEETLDVLSGHPERLQEIPGMGRKRWKQIAQAYQEQEGARTAMVFLQTYGIPATLSIKISKLYGDRTPAMIRENPYRLCEDIDGVGFLTADRIGTSLGVPPDSEGRICAALKYILKEAAATQGHLYLPRQELLGRAVQLLRVEEALVGHYLMRLTLLRDLIQSGADGEERVYLPAFDSAEREVALRLCELMTSCSADGTDGAAKEIDKFQNKHGITFSDRQREAILTACREGVLVITGGPGTGKTTIINCMISLLSREGEVALCAPTGRAAKRMTEATGMEAKTIHRLLEYGGDEGQFARNQENPIEADTVIVDEVSMVDLMLMRSLLRAIEPGTRLILVGDADQLPSVGAGNVLGDVLDSGVVPSCMLTDIFRQGETSRIVVNAHRINHGEMPLLNEKGTDFFFERKLTFGEAAQTIVALVKQRLPRFLRYDPAQLEACAVRNIQVLAPAKKGECGVIALNQLLQAALNPPGKDKPCLQYGETIFRLGDKVMQTKNDYQQEWRRLTATGWEDGQGVFNGDVGFIVDVDAEEHCLTVRFDEEKEAVYASAQLENLDLAYCLSVHKSQGSEFPVVVMPVVGGPPMLLTRNLFYTALTRARSLVVLVGREDAVRMMVENDHVLKRYTTLCERLQSVSALSPQSLI